MLSDDLIKGAPGAALHTGLPLRTIYHLAATKQIPSVRLGRTLFFKKSDLDRVFKAAA